MNNDLKEIYLQYKKVYLELKRLLTIREAEALDAGDTTKVQECEEELKALDQMYHRGIEMIEKQI